MNQRRKKQFQQSAIDEKTYVSEPAKVEKIPNKWKLVLFLFGFLLYANTVNFGYVLDDKIVVTANQITKKGFEGVLDHFTHDLMDGFWAEQYGISVDDLEKNSLVVGGRYRPLSVATYAIEWELFGESPGISHLINAFFYGVIGVVFFVLLQNLFPSSILPVWKSIPFWVTLLFLAHPLHVEVVANIKGRDEVFNLLFGLLSLQYLVGFCKTKEIKPLVISAVMLFLSLLSKETTVVFVVIGPLMIYYFNLGGIKEVKKSFLFLLGSTVLYNIIRYLIVGSPADPIARELMNNPFLLATEGERIATILLTVAVYFKLIFIPHPLTHDYYPFHLPFLDENEQYANWGSLGTIVGLLILIWLAYVAIKGIKNKNIYSFAILFSLATIVLVSNVLFPIGVFMNERFMFIPSVGIAFALAHFLTGLTKRKWFALKDNWVYGGLALLLILFSGLTYQRSLAWESDKTLALADVQVSLGSAKVKMAAADALLQDLPSIKNQQKRNEVIESTYQYLSRSLEIYPEYFPPLDLLARMYFESGNYTESIKFYEYCVNRKVNNTQFVENIFVVGNKLVEVGQFEQAFTAYQKALGFSPNDKRYLLAIAQVSARDLQNPSQGLPFMEKAYKLYPADIEVAEKMAITYAMLGRFQNAIGILTPLYDANPNNSGIVKNLGIVYYQMGDTQRGTVLMNKSTEMESSKN